MRKQVLFILLSIISISSFAENVTLLITYNGNGVSGHTVSIMLGGSKLGSGVTDNSGKVSINVSSLPSKHIDLKGEKTCSNAQKSWEVKGYVTLDGSNYAHLKMEEPIAEIAEASGGFMSEKTLAGSYGLICSGSSSTSNSTTSNTDNSASSNDSNLGTLPTYNKEESLESQKQMLEGKIQNQTRKIDKNIAKIESEEVVGKNKNEALYDVKELKIEREISKNKLEKVNLTLEKGSLNKYDRKRFKETNESLKEELDSVKAERKKGVSLISEEEKMDGIVLTEEDLANMNTIGLKKKKIALKSNLGKKKMKLKTQRKVLSPNKITLLESEIEALEASIILIDTELDNRSAEKEAVKD